MLSWYQNNYHPPPPRKEWIISANDDINCKTSDSINCKLMKVLRTAKHYETRQVERDATQKKSVFELLWRKTAVLGAKCDFFSSKFSVPFLLEEKFHRNFRLIVRGQNLHNYHLNRLFTAINLEQYNLFNIL